MGLYLVRGESRVLLVFAIGGLVAASAFLDGCAQVMAYNQASPIDRSILTPRVDR